MLFPVGVGRLGRMPKDRNCETSQAYVDWPRRASRCIGPALSVILKLPPQVHQALRQQITLSEHGVNGGGADAHHPVPDVKPQRAVPFLASQGDGRLDVLGKELIHLGLVVEYPGGVVIRRLLVDMQ